MSDQFFKILKSCNQKYSSDYYDSAAYVKKAPSNQKNSSNSFGFFSRNTTNHSSEANNQTTLVPIKLVQQSHTILIEAPHNETIEWLKTKIVETLGLFPSAAANLRLLKEGKALLNDMQISEVLLQSSAKLNTSSTIQAIFINSEAIFISNLVRSPSTIIAEIPAPKTIPNLSQPPARNADSAPENTALLEQQFFGKFGHLVNTYFSEADSKEIVVNFRAQMQKYLPKINSN